MKTIISLIIVLMYSGCIFATPRTPKQAMLIARTFIGSNAKMSHINTANLSVAAGCDRITRAAEANPAYYIINAENNAGFVIVSGDDSVRDILAYSNKGNIDYNNLPDNVKYWLDFYTQEINNAVNFGTANDDSYIETRAAKPVIEPLLGDIAWNQDEPYNLKCPLASGNTRTVTGCGATAMAMVMRYYNYPAHGTGSKNYTTATLKKQVGADFENTYYKWEQMLPQYNSTATNEQRNAVAELMYHCGVALNMDFNVASSNGSSAGVFSQYDALIKNFGYNPNMYFRGRDFTTLGKWEKTVQDELLASRPVLYTGQGKNGGHAFVCDGSDGDGKYHFNWGWSGYANGYYALSALNPGTGGIGAGAGSYNDSQYILCGVQPEATEDVVSGFVCEGTATASKTSYGRNEAIDVTFTEVYNVSSVFNGVYGLALYNGDEFVTFLSEPTKNSVGVGMGWSRAAINGKVPASVPDGSYQLYLATQNYGEKTPTRLFGMEKTVMFYNVEIAGNTITLTKPTSNVSLMQAAPAEIVGISEVGSDITFKLQVENSGMTYEDEFGVYIAVPGDRFGLVKARISNYVVLPGSTTSTVTITGNPGLPAGEYYAIGSYKTGSDWKEFGNSKLRLTFTIAEEGTGIKDITDNSNGTKRIYTIGGQYVGTDFNALDKGVYIVNGKKVIK